MGHTVNEGECMRVCIHVCVGVGVCMCGCVGVGV